MHLHAAFLFAQEIGKFFCVNCIGSFKLNNSRTTQHKNFKNFSGGSRNDALPMYIHEKIPKSRKTVLLRQKLRLIHFHRGATAKK